MRDFLKSVTEGKNKQVATDPRRFAVVEPPPFAPQVLEAERPLTLEGLKNLGLEKVKPARVAKLDSVEAIDDLLLIGERYAEKYLKLETWSVFAWTEPARNDAVVLLQSCFAAEF